MEREIIVVLYFLAVLCICFAGVEIYKRNYTIKTYFCTVFGVLGGLIATYLTSNDAGVFTIGDKAAFGQFGDFIGGVLNPIVGTVTVLLLFASIKEQRKINTIISEAEHINSNKQHIQNSVEKTIHLYENLLSEKIFLSYQDQCESLDLSSDNSMRRLIPRSIVDILFGNDSLIKPKLVNTLKDLHSEKGDDSPYEGIDSSEETLNRIPIEYHIRTLRQHLFDIIEGFIVLIGLENTKYMVSVHYQRADLIIRKAGSYLLMSESEAHEFNRRLAAQKSFFKFRQIRRFQQSDPNLP